MFFSASCMKQVDYSAAIDSLKASVAALQKTSDSLANALAATNSNIADLSKTVDSINVQITSINGQIALLNQQLATVNANLTSIDSQIAALNKKLADLLAELKIIINQLNVTPTSLSNGLSAWYPFTGNAIDSSGNGNDGIVSGATLASSKSGDINSAYSFNGNSDYILLQNPFFQGGQVSVFTMYARVYFNSISNSPNIWGKSLSWGEVNFKVNADGSIELFWANSVSGNKYSQIISQSNMVNSGSWYDIAVVFQNSVGKIYLNGMLITTNLMWSAQGNVVLSTTQIEPSCNFAQDPNSSRFGARITGGVWGNYLNGRLDDFRLYNRALTPSEITFLATH